MSANMREVQEKQKKVKYEIRPSQSKKNVKKPKTGVVLFVLLLSISHQLHKSNHFE